MSSQTVDLRAQALLNAMKSGRRGIFIDDGGGHHDLPSNVLVQDYLLYVAVFVENSEIFQLENNHQEWLRDARRDAPLVNEVHCNEIAAGSKAWANISTERRAFHLDQAYKKLMPAMGKFLYGAIGKQQYQDLMTQAATLQPNLNPRYASQKTGLPFNFYKPLADFLSKEPGESVIIHDQGLQVEWSKEEIFQQSVPVWEHSIFHVRSDLFAGVQLADLVAWTFNRMFRVNHRQQKGESLKEIDQIVALVHPSMMSYAINVWDLADEEEETGKS